MMGASASAERDARGPQLPHGPAWSTWMTSRAQRLWELRAAFAAAHPDDCALVAATEREHRAPGAPRQLLVVTRPDVFLSLEGELGLELCKPHDKSHLARALTGVNGDEWRDQRTLLTRRVFPAGLGDGRPLRLAEEETTRALVWLASAQPSGTSLSARQLELKAELLEPLCARWWVPWLSCLALSADLLQSPQPSALVGY
ncbi:hypothetical protein T492DRAFT_964365 [Pavlovales sp. CCMP2436]|nr:hypothetical protein T492DRAFT_964365 [Pavlovales sp. CCMP2436]